MTISCETETAGALPQRLQIRTHVLRADVGVASGGTDSAPDPHDYFDASLAACKALTVTLAARARGMALERVEVHVDRDKRDEQAGTYRLAVRLVLHGALTDGQRRVLQVAAEHCPIHKLMTTTDVVIATTLE